jgi:hypothetical protein
VRPCSPSYAWRLPDRFPPLDRLDPFFTVRERICVVLTNLDLSPMLQASELRRCFDDLKLTMKVYTDASQLPLIAEAARLPSFSLPWNDSKERTQEEVVLGSEGSSTVASNRSDASVQVSEVVAFRREKTAEVASSGFHKMERAKRLELSTSTLARWCSTN